MDVRRTFLTAGTCRGVCRGQHDDERDVKRPLKCIGVSHETKGDGTMPIVPVRLRLSRAKGFDLQAHSRSVNGLPAVNVARPSPWGNPFVVGVDGTRAECVRLHGILLCGDDGRGMYCLSTKASVEAQRTARAQVVEHLADLRGKNLACWCPADAPCHADLLLKLAAECRHSRRRASAI
jgi:hypothetical protein